MILRTCAEEEIWVASASLQRLPENVQTKHGLETHIERVKEK